MSEIASPLTEKSERRGSRVAEALRWLFLPIVEAAPPLKSTDEILRERGWEVWTPSSEDAAAELARIVSDPTDS